MTVPFLEVVLYTLNETSKQSIPVRGVDVVRVKSADGLEETHQVPPERRTNSVLDKTRRFMLPTCSCIFTLIFWIVGPFKSYSYFDIKETDMSDCLKSDLG